jgi:hypothetical protein
MMLSASLFAMRHQPDLGHAVYLPVADPAEPVHPQRLRVVGVVHLQVVIGSAEVAWLASYPAISERIPRCGSGVPLLGFVAALAIQGLPSLRLPVRKGAPSAVVSAVVVHVLPPVLYGVGSRARLALVQVSVCHERVAVELIDMKDAAALETLLGHGAFS